MKTVEPAVTPSKKSAGQPSGRDRRRDPRVLIVQPVRLCGSLASGGQFQEVRSTVDVSKGGFYFTTPSDYYVKGMHLVITFPYVPEEPDSNQIERVAEVMRVVLHPDGQRGIGCRFIEPTAHSADGAAAARSERKPGAAHNVIMVLDDDARAHRLIRSALEPNGYVVLIIATADEALAEMRQQVPAMLLVEIAGNGSEGADLCHIIKSSPKVKDVPLAVTTERGEIRDYRIARDLNAVICIPKPYKADRLLQVVRLLAPLATTSPA